MARTACHCWIVLQHPAANSVKATSHGGKRGGKWGYKYPICILPDSQSGLLINLNSHTTKHNPEKGYPSAENSMLVAA